ncbi:SDR family NAD(P)-dependent oxidoreductase [Bacillus sp. T33-2]|uniref:SDR family NAD(P)-dependent oxidoreductase n=1 Tax=Bacillus sp. T33-2 TaxID=2054168 RepID=UPI000C7631FB|nr:SDR family oxidoreductase [Bacillus sp. T33-2]PLR95394.1 short-chain dehydrogenase [Bacillus sp. T33-2]
MRSIIITGAGSGLGKELSILLAEKGYHIILAGRTESKLHDVKKHIEHEKGSASVHILDIRNLEDVKEKILSINHKYDIYGLFNNAGIGFFGPFVAGSDTEIEDTFATNVFGTIHMTKAVLPYLEMKQEGLVVNIISTAGLRGKKNEAVYASSKFAVRGFTESLQKEYERSNIRFIAAYMGGMDTPFWESSEHVADPKRFRSPREVAELIVSQLDQDNIIIESKKQ